VWNPASPRIDQIEKKHTAASTTVTQLKKQRHIQQYNKWCYKISNWTEPSYLFIKRIWSRWLLESSNKVVFLCNCKIPTVHSVPFTNNLQGVYRVLQYSQQMSVVIIVSSWYWTVEHADVDLIRMAPGAWVCWEDQRFTKHTRMLWNIASQKALAQCLRKL